MCGNNADGRQTWGLGAAEEHFHAGPGKEFNLSRRSVGTRTDSAVYDLEEVASISRLVGAKRRPPDTRPFQSTPPGSGNFHTSFPGVCDPRLIAATSPWSKTKTFHAGALERGQIRNRFDHFRAYPIPNSILTKIERYTNDHWNAPC